METEALIIIKSNNHFSEVSIFTYFFYLIYFGNPVNLLYRSSFTKHRIWQKINNN